MATISPAEYETRVRQLEKQCATFSAQVDRQAKVVEAARHWYNNGTDWSKHLAEAVATYDAAMAALTREAR